MANLARVNSAVRILADINTHLKKLISGYQLLPSIFEKEYLAIEDHDISALEVCCESKVHVTSEIERNTQKYQELISDLMPSFERVDLESDKGKHFEICQRSLNKLLSECVSDPMVHSMLAYQTRLYEKNWNQLKDEFRLVIPMINKNKSIIQKILHNHQESHKFWLRIMTEQAAPYNEKGKRKSTEAQSTLNITA